MKRPLLLTATLILFVLALVFSSPYRSGVARAEQPDPCSSATISSTKASSTVTRRSANSNTVQPTS